MSRLRDRWPALLALLVLAGVGVAKLAGRAAAAVGDLVPLGAEAAAPAIKVVGRVVDYPFDMVGDGFEAVTSGTYGGFVVVLIVAALVAIAGYIVLDLRSMFRRGSRPAPGSEDQAA